MQSLAVLLLFSAFLQGRKMDSNLDIGTITALEEPEAHLHPCAIRSLAKAILNLFGQVIMSTHSGDLLSAVDSVSIRRFVVSNGNTNVHSISPGALGDGEMRKFESHVRWNRGELLYARCWLLVEGEADAILYSGVADALGVDLDREGVRCVEYRQTGIKALSSIANQLGIEWCIVADDDAQGLDDIGVARQSLIGADYGDRLMMPYKNPETLLYEVGFENIYRETKKLGDNEDVDRETRIVPHGSFGKPGAAYRAVQEMLTGKMEVPKVLAKVVYTAVEVASKSND